MNSVVCGYELEAVEVDRGSGTARSQFEREQTSAGMAIIQTLVEVMDVDPLELAPLHGSVDPDALDAIVGVGHGMEEDIHVTFTHEGHPITVSSDGGVKISRGHEPSPEHSGSDA